MAWFSYQRAALTAKINHIPKHIWWCFADRMNSGLDWIGFGENGPTDISETNWYCVLCGGQQRWLLVAWSSVSLGHHHHHHYHRLNTSLTVLVGLLVQRHYRDVTCCRSDKQTDRRTDIADLPHAVQQWVVSVVTAWSRSPPTVNCGK